MCGLLYTRVFRPERINLQRYESSFKEALQQMKYRGPDATGYLRHGHHFFGHVRLSIVDVNASSNQPVEDDQHIMLFTGEIYNYKSLEKNSRSDTLTLFRRLKSSPQPFSGMRGMFAIGFFSKAEDTVVFYRDFFGEKPLYYYGDQDLFMASSTIRSLRFLLKSCGKSVSLNQQRIVSDYLLFGYIREPETVYQEVRQLRAGYSLSVSAHALHLQPIQFHLAQVPIEATEYLQNAIRSTDVPATLLLSGGVDSAMVLHACNGIPHQFTGLVYRSANAQKDESGKGLENFKKIVQAQPNSWEQFVVTNTPDEKRMYRDYIRCLEQPTTDGMNLFNILSEYTRTHPSKLILTGLGGDELYGGYNSFRHWTAISMLARLGRYLPVTHPKIKRFVAGRKILAEWNAHAYCFLYRMDYSIWKGVFAEDAALLSLSYNYYLESIQASFPFLPNQPNPLLELKRAECVDYMRNQLLRDNDNISMHFSIESRSPLLDPEKFSNVPDHRRWMRRLLKRRYSLQFGRKKGFTFTPLQTDGAGPEETAETLNRHLGIQVRNKTLLGQRKLRQLSDWLNANLDAR